MNSSFVIFAVFENSGFTRTLCGSTWDSLTDTSNAFTNLGSSTARYGCCPANEYMSSPFIAFLEADSCSECPVDQFANDLNDDTACTSCATVADSSARTCNAATDHNIEYCNLLYCNSYSDLRQAFCDDLNDGIENGVCTTPTHAVSCYAHWENSGKTEGRLPDPDECMKKAGIQTVTCNTGFVSFCCCCYFLHCKIYFYCKRILF